MATFVRTQEIEHDIGSHGRLALRVTEPDVQIRAADGNTARVLVTFEIDAGSDSAADDIFERIKYQVVQDNGSLEVTEPKNWTSGGIGSLARIFAGGAGRAEARVDASAPSTCDLRYDGVSADLTVTGFGATQEYRTVSGDIVLEGISGDVQLKGVSGDVSLRANGTLSSVELNTVSGDVSLVAPRIGQLRAATISGDLDIEGILDDGPEHRVETVSGDLALGVAGGLTLEVRGLSTDVAIRLPHRSEGSRDRRRYVLGDGGPQLRFSSMSGDVEVRAPRRADVHAPPPAPPAPTTPDLPNPPSPPEPADQLAVLKALERGEIDVDEATRRLAGGAGPRDV